jgi:hypothetical protein
MRLLRPFLRVLDTLGGWWPFSVQPLQNASNFVILTGTYFVGIGITSIFYRLGPGKKKIVCRENSFWQPVSTVPREKDTWMRPF